MPEEHAAVLGRILNEHRSDPVIRSLHDSLLGLTANGQAPNPSALIELHKACIRGFEPRLSSSGYSDTALADYQRICRGYEALMAGRGDDDRHRFMVIIPTADRPRQLQDCLASLLELCRLYEYGGRIGSRYRKVSAMIADDSKDPTSIRQHRELARHFNAQGLETLYFGLDDQRAELERLPDDLRKRLGTILGHPDPNAFHHKGHSVMRNILYLRLQAQYANDSRQLFYFADSDQEFRIKIGDRRGDRDLYALNYFHHLDRLFSDSDIEILTGKVVGDPPVSPAVMAGNFLDDVRAFLTQAEGFLQEAPCPFHDQALPQEDGAAYHDMAGLFGFKADRAVHRYRCSLHGPHALAACLDDFMRKLSHFFDGEHPTRITYFDAADTLDIPGALHGAQTQAARTLYTGNYVIRAQALRYFVPFAPLRLRMSGPTFGRLLQSELGARFVSANLPMLHKRTVDETGASEFRPGVVKQAQHIDLTNEFERQFFGDVMLFSIENLTAMGYPMHAVAETVVADTLSDTAERMARLYREKHAQILDRLDTLRQLRKSMAGRFTATPTAWARFDTFLDNMTHNFGPEAEGYRLIANRDHRQQRHAQLLAAIVNYRADRVAWEAALNESASAPSRA